MLHRLLCQNHLLLYTRSCQAHFQTLNQGLIQKWVDLSWTWHIWSVLQMYRTILACRCCGGGVVAKKRTIITMTEDTIEYWHRHYYWRRGHFYCHRHCHGQLENGQQSGVTSMATAINLIGSLFICPIERGTIFLLPFVSSQPIHKRRWWFGKKFEGWLMTNIVLTLWALKGDWFYGSGGLDKGNIRYFLLWFDFMSVTMTLMMPTCTRSSSPTAPSRPRQRICKREILVRKIIWDLKKRKSHTCYFVIHFLRQMKKSEIKLTERTEMLLV